MSDDDKDTLNRLKKASEALDAAQKASRNTVRDVARAKRAVTKAKKGAQLLSLKVKRSRKRAAKNHR